MLLVRRFLILKTIIAASNNENKICEIKSILSGLNYEILSLKDAGIDIDPEEIGLTFQENAIIKAKAASFFTDLMVIADDSGLSVNCLNGLPGVISKRFAGENASDEDNNIHLVNKLKSIKKRKFKASFQCCIALIDQKGDIKVFKGSCSGEILMEPRGSNGFGYDPYFYMPKLKKTMAQLTEYEKNSVSHRGDALRKLKKYLEKGLI